MRLRGHPGHSRHSIAAWTRWDPPIVAAGTHEETGETGVNPSGGTAIDVFGYSYTADGELTPVSDDNSPCQFAYNAAGLVSQETRMWTSGADTDTLGFTYTSSDQLTGVTHTDDATGDVWTCSYKFRNLMSGAVEKTGGGTVLAQVTYTYDALDNRIGMEENGTQTWTLYDGSTPIMDFNSSGSLTMRYLNGPAGDIVDTVLARESAGGTIAWYLPDRLGTIRDLLNNSGASSITSITAPSARSSTSRTRRTATG